MHNDSGGEARLFAVTEDGRLRGIFPLAHADSVDWEDMALGPCRNPNEDCLYVGDIGDNFRERPQIQVYRTREPAVPLGGAPVRATLVGTERFECGYPDGPHDAETLFVDPATGTPYIVTKEPEGSGGGVYRFPGGLDSGRVATLEKVSTLPGRSSLTGGDITRDGSLILLRDYFSAYAYVRPERGEIPEAFATQAGRIPLPWEEQGEALGLSSSGDRVYTASEGRNGPIHRAECTHRVPRGTTARSSAPDRNGFE